jgi:hypothetical protein
MSKVLRYAVIGLLVFFIFAGQSGSATDISVIGSWSETIDENDLLAGAGSDLKNSYESPDDQVLITISGTTGGWRVDIKKVDGNWHADLALSVRRTGSGAGGSVSGGDTYTEVTATDQPFFTGSGGVSGITAQIKLSGISIQVLPGNYSTTVYYTVVDT